MKINIYITNEEKEKLKILQSKYKLSMSTIADILLFATYQALLRNKKANAKDIMKKTMEEYIKKEGATKTSIKPKFYGGINTPGFTMTNKDLFATNCLRIYLDKKIIDLVDEETKKDYNNKINKELQKRKEEYYNYNEHIRNTMRFLKGNKEYVKHKIEMLEKKGA